MNEPRRGGWPKGKRRHEGGENAQEFLRMVGEYCRANRATSELAEYLGVSRQVLYRYFDGVRLPAGPRLEQITQWYARQ